MYSYVIRKFKVSEQKASDLAATQDYSGLTVDVLTTVRKIH